MSPSLPEIVDTVLGVATLVSAIALYVWTRTGDDAGLPTRRWSTIALRFVVSVYVVSLWLSWWDWWEESAAGGVVRVVASWLTLVFLVVWAVSEARRRRGLGDAVGEDAPTA